ncbi:MAG: hypothetical protein GY769_26140 [bacterium]|nr:hypothetical protein [bacterium]
MDRAVWNTPSERRTKSQKLAQEALTIEAEEARAAGALGFTARILVQATLPHSRPHKGPNPHEFERVNGRFTLYMNAPPSVGLPYGSYPRLALAWLSTEAVRTRNREIELGPTFSSFMYKLGLTPVTGKRGTTSRLRDQLHRLFSTTIRCTYSDDYSWLTYRMSYLCRPCLIPWEALQTQFGADYGQPRDFKRKFLGHLADVLHVYPAVRLSDRPMGLLLRQSPTHLRRALGTLR